MKRTFRVIVDSPYGKQPVSQFKHFLNKISDEAETRWGITITITEVAEENE